MGTKKVKDKPEESGYNPADYTTFEDKKGGGLKDLLRKIKKDDDKAPEQDVDNDSGPTL